MFFLLFFYFFIQPSSHSLVSGNGGLLNLDVVLVEVLLEVEVGEGFTSGHGQELAESSVRLDVVLVLEALFLDVGGHGLGDIGAGHLRTLGLAEEGAEVIRKASGDLEDGEASRLGLTVGVNGGGRAALALTSILDLTVDTLVELLQLAVESGDDFTEAVELGDHTLDLIANRLNRRMSRGIRGDHRGSDGGRSRGRSGLSLGSGLLGDLLGLGGGWGRGGYRGRDRGNRGSILGLLGNALGGGLGGRGGVHCTSSGGRIHLYFTHYPKPMTATQSNFSS